VEKNTGNYRCQYTALTEVGCDLNPVEKGYQWLVRIYRAIKRRLRRRGSKNFSKREEGFDRTSLGGNSGEKLKVGDIVRILPCPEIKATLNEQGYYKGLSFMENMEKYCGKSFKILEIPTHVMDRGGKKINKCKNVIILDGLYCDGTGTVSEEGCERSCLHYWKGDWLRKEF
jgi:hypothetical protein